MKRVMSDPGMKRVMSDPGRSPLVLEMQRSAKPQHMRLDALGKEVGLLDGCFKEAQLNRDMHQKRLAEMIEDTLKQVQRARAHMDQKKQHVQDTTKSYAAKFEHELACAREELRRDLKERIGEMEGAVGKLKTHMQDLDAALKHQHQVRKEQIENTLGPIRDDVAQLCAELERERSIRRKQEEQREKLLADQVEAVSNLIDEEKFRRERQVAEFARWADLEQELLEKRQYQEERETRDSVKTISADLQTTAKERIQNQEGVIESIASFVKRYREQVAREVMLHDGILTPGGN